MEPCGALGKKGRRDRENCKFKVLGDAEISGSLLAAWQHSGGTQEAHRRHSRVPVHEDTVDGIIKSPQGTLGKP